ncbi:plasmolipin [Lepisosteus oculatus]|uniref:plasmolipin n=1 Tax=Lepisosteus oculatus TaxID=7918 RepID=UPI0035F50C50
MAEFPGKVNTETSSPSQTAVQGFSVRLISLDLIFIRTVPAILMITEIALGLLVWALIASTQYFRVPGFGWVMFVSVFLWILTILVFFIYFLRVNSKLVSVPWTIVLLAFNVTAAVLYITAFLTASASITPYFIAGTLNFNNLAAAAFFACLVMIAYCASSFLSFMGWRREGGGTIAQAAGTVPA